MVYKSIIMIMIMIIIIILLLLELLELLLSTEVYGQLPF